MIKNIIFDFGAVLVDWNPHYLYDEYFASREKADWFLTNICTSKWNSEMDAGKPFEVATDELASKFPEWKNEIKLYWKEWMKMTGDPISGMYDYVYELKQRGYRIIGLSNWSAETFPKVRVKYPIFSLIEEYVLSGEEHLIKPDPRIFQRLLEKYSINPSESIFIDDSSLNVETAKELGINAIRFINCQKLREELEIFLSAGLA